MAGHNGDIFDCYAFICKVNHEQDKIYYWKQWEKFYHVLDPLIDTWKFKKVDFEQNFEMLLKSPKDGPYKLTIKKASTGGFRTWNYQNNFEITTKYLSKNDHLIYSFNNYGKFPIDFFPADKSGLINIFHGWVIASSDKRKKTNEIMDLYIKIGNLNRVHENSTNQYLYVFVKQNSFKKDLFQKFLIQTYKLTYGENLYYNFRPFQITSTDQNGWMNVNDVTVDDYRSRKPGDLNQAGNQWIEVRF